MIASSPLKIFLDQVMVLWHPYYHLITLVTLPPQQIISFFPHSMSIMIPIKLEHSLISTIAFHIMTEIIFKGANCALKSE